MKLRLTILSAAEVVAFGGALVYYLYRISSTLTRTGGAADSQLARISFGVRAIEKETSHLTPQVGRLNEGLGTLAARLGAAEENLGAVARVLSGGEAR